MIKLAIFALFCVLGYRFVRAIGGGEEKKLPDVQPGDRVREAFSERRDVVDADFREVGENGGAPILDEEGGHDV